MPLFRVIWDIDIDADSPEEAARLALEIQRDPASTALHFDVCTVGPGAYDVGEPQGIILQESEEDTDNG